MYQLWGGGSPFTVQGDGTKQLIDRAGTPVKLLGISSHILQTLKTEEKWKETITAWVSCTDEPDWAAECLKLFKVIAEEIAPSNAFANSFDLVVEMQSAILIEIITSNAQTAEGESIGNYIDSSQIYKSNKQEHFKKLKSEYKSIEYSDMLFFDNEMGNIKSVSKLGVKCVYCPDGMTERIWDEGLKMF